MNLVALPIKADGAHFSFTTELSGSTWGFEFRWNPRAEQWIMLVRDGNGTVLVSGIRIRVGLPLLQRFRAYGSLPPGEMIALDDTGQNLDPGFADLGRRVMVYYAS